MAREVEPETFAAAPKGPSSRTACAGSAGTPSPSTPRPARRHCPTATRRCSHELRRAVGGDEPPPVLDVRNTAEREEGFIEGSLHIPLAELARRVDEIPADRPLVVHCAGGHRSFVAAGLLRHKGRGDVSDLLGGYGAWLARPAPADV